MDNIINLKCYNNFKHHGLSVLQRTLSTLFTCDVSFQYDPIATLKETSNIDISSCPNRSYYKINNNEILIVFKVFDESAIHAVLPTIFKGTYLALISTSMLEKFANAVSVQLTKSFKNKFYDSPLLLGEELESKIIISIFAKHVFSPNRMIYVLSLFKKLSTITFEGKYFSTGLILSKSYYDYREAKICDRKGIMLSLNSSKNIMKMQEINKRDFYLVDGIESYYFTNQSYIIKNIFVLNNEKMKSVNYIDSYTLSKTLYGSDIVFRTLKNQISILNSHGDEFFYSQGNWKYRNSKILMQYLSSNSVNSNIITSLIYYIYFCSQNNISTIIWLPNKIDVIDNVLHCKFQILDDLINITNNSYDSIIKRILSSDGATIINSFGDIIHYGCIVKPDNNITRITGTGENAIKTLSSNGIAIKVSQDGTIKICKDNNIDFIF